MANYSLGTEREERIEEFASNGLPIKLNKSQLMRVIIDAFLNNPSLFLPQFTINSENSHQKDQSAEQAA